MRIREISGRPHWDQPASYSVWVCCLLAAAGWGLSFYCWGGGDPRGVAFLRHVFWAWTGAVPMALVAMFVGSRARRLAERRYSLLGIGSYALYSALMVLATVRG